MTFKEVKPISSNGVILHEDEKDNIKVGFSKKRIIDHKGITGLKYYLIVMYLRKYVGAFGHVTLSINHLMEECGYSTRSHNKSSYDDFRKIIKAYILDKEYATSNADILKVSPSTYFTIQLSAEKSIFFSNEDFVLLSIEEFEKIASAKTRVNKSILMGAYLYIKQFISGDRNSPISQLIAYPSKVAIKRGLGISSTTTIETAIKYLVNELHLLYMRSDFYMEDNYTPDQYVQTRNVYALAKNDLTEKACIWQLESFYNKKIYLRGDAPGEINFITKNNRLKTEEN